MQMQTQCKHKHNSSIYPIQAQCNADTITNTNIMQIQTLIKCKHNASTNISQAKMQSKHYWKYKQKVNAPVKQQKMVYTSDNSAQTINKMIAFKIIWYLYAIVLVFMHNA